MKNITLNELEQRDQITLAEAASIKGGPHYRTWDNDHWGVVLTTTQYSNVTLKRG